MSTDFVIATKDNPPMFYDNVSKGDAVTYTFDFSPWQDDNSAITSILWTIESGNAEITNQTFADGVASALVSFPDETRTTISVLATTTQERKKVWLNVVAKDQMINYPFDGYCRC